MDRYGQYPVSDNLTGFPSLILLYQAAQYLMTSHYRLQAFNKGTTIHFGSELQQDRRQVMRGPR
ncbi:hypothetical protein D3C76_1873510 [compost metagenome]